MRALSWLWLVSVVSGAGVLLGGVAGAHAQTPSLDACGNIYIEAGAECEVIPPQANCELACEDFSVQAACAAELKLECDAMCKIEASAKCNVDCQADCDVECRRKPGEFDCQAYCQGGCSGECSGHCAAGAAGASCRASCEATCSGDCNAQCKIRPPTVDCSGSCQASCQGSCKAQANIDCQANCQADGFVNCEAKVTGGCKADCQTQQGALFCDGYYVDSGDNLQMCAAALEALIQVDVDYSGSYEGECKNGVCTASAEGSASCSALPGQSAGGSWLTLFGVGLGLCVARRRRSR